MTGSEKRKRDIEQYIFLQNFYKRKTVSEKRKRETEQYTFVYKSKIIRLKQDWEANDCWPVSLNQGGFNKPIYYANVLCSAGSF